MKIRKILFNALFLSFMMVSITVNAQFQGQITMLIYSEDNAEQSIGELNLYATPDRIMLQREEPVSFLDGEYNATGLLIRNDKKDFVVMVGEGEALHFTKEELEGLFSMIGMMSGEDKSVNSNSDMRYTNKIRKIKEYDCTELLISTEENKETLSVWLTSGIDINWGMLAEPWNNVPDNMKNSANTLSQEFKSQNFPMLVEVNKKGKTETLFEVTNINKSSIAKAMVEVPAGTNLVGLQSMIFKMMMGN